MSKIPLHNLPGFIAAARLGSLSRAAASLHVTVSALSGPAVLDLRPAEARA